MVHDVVVGTRSDCGVLRCAHIGLITTAIAMLHTASSEPFLIKIGQRLLWGHWRVGVHRILRRHSMEGLVWLLDLLRLMLDSHSRLFRYTFWACLLWKRPRALCAISLPWVAVGRFLLVLWWSLFRCNGARYLSVLLPRRWCYLFASPVDHVVVESWLFCRVKCELLRKFGRGFGQTPKRKNGYLLFRCIQRCWVSWQSRLVLLKLLL